jgi:hypothetical protein
MTDPVRLGKLSASPQVARRINARELSLSPRRSREAGFQSQKETASGIESRRKIG